MGAKDLLVDSNKLLAETEALLASCGGDEPQRQEQHGVSTASEPISEEEKRRRKRLQQAAKRRSKYRAKLKNERQTLEQEEKTLSTELQSLQQVRKRIKVVRERSVAVPVWRAIATRQMEGRLVAEEQQRRLTSAVRNRATLIAEVGEMMQQKLSESKERHAASQRAVCNSVVELDAEDTALYEEYLQDLDEIYSQTDAVFRAQGVEECPQYSYKLEQQRKNDGDVEYFDNLDVLLMPFEYEQTCSAMWRAMSLVHGRRDRRHYGGVTEPERTFAVKFLIACPREDGRPVDMLIHLVMRKYVEPTRMVIVWRALSEGQDEFSGMHSDETGWCVVRPVRTETDEVPVMPTIMQTFVRFVPLHVGDNKPNVGQFTKLVLVSGEEDGAEVARMMQSLVLEDPR